MPEKKSQSLFEDTLRHDVHTVSELWRNEQRRRRVLMARIFVPVFVLVIGGWLLTARYFRVFPFRPTYEELVAEAKAERANMPSENVFQDNPWIEKLGYEKALLKIEVVEQGCTCCSPDGLLKLLYAFSDENPSRIYMERWSLEKYTGKLKELIGKEHQYAVFINGNASIDIKQADGKIMQLSLVFNAKDTTFYDKLALGLNQEYQRVYKTDKEALNYQAFSAKRKADEDAEAKRRAAEKEEDIVLKKVKFDIGK